MRRSDGPEGVEKVLSPRERSRVEQVFAHASPSLRQELEALIAPLGAVQSAVLLRAVAARVSEGPPLRRLLVDAAADAE